MKREADGEMGSPQKRSRKGDEEVRLLIPSKVAGSIIGKGGQNITKLRSQYKASITVPDCPGPERMLTLSSDLNTICRIVSDVVPNLEENGGRINGNELDLRMMIHQSQAGCVIGKSGYKIKELRDKCGARIKIFSNMAPQSTDRIIQIVGEPSKCIDSIREIVTLIKQSPIKGAVNPYDPHNYDEYYAEEYGGWGGGGSGNDRRTGGGNTGGGSRGGGGGGGGRNGMRNGQAAGRYNNRGGGGPPPPLAPQRASNGPMSFNDRPPRGPPPASYGRSNDMSGGGIGGVGRHHDVPSFDRNGWDAGNPPPPPPPPPSSMMQMNGPPQNGNGLLGDKTTTQVTIPKDLAGAIIGKGGSRIRKIRQDSGAGITIDEPLPGSNDRIITITGLPNQIQMAQYLLQQSVHNNTERSYQ